MNKTSWTVAQAKAKLNEVIDQAQSEGPQTITRNGRNAVVRTGNLAEFFAASPLPGAPLSLERSPEKPRKIKL